MHTSKDVQRGIGRATTVFWIVVGVHYGCHKLVGCSEHPTRLLETKWEDIKFTTNKFSGVHDAIVALKELGKTNDDQIQILEVNRTRDEIVQTNTHTHRHMNVYRGGFMLSLLCLLFFFFFSLCSYKQYRITLIPLRPTLWPYFIFIISHASFITFLLIMSNLMLYLLQFLLVLHFY